MADVVLVFPTTGFAIKGLSIDIPVSLLAVASTVVGDYSVKIIDQRMDQNWEQALLAELKCDPLCVGISSMTGPQLAYALEASRMIKESGSNTKVVWGGVHPSLLSEQTLESEYVDIVCVGEGEVTFRNLVNALAERRDLQEVKGLAFKKNGEIIRTEPELPVDLNELPELPYDLVPIEEYVGSQGRFEDDNARSLLFLSSRGCPWRCSFCCNPRLSKRQWRAMRPELAYERVSNLVDRYKLDAVTFHDEEFFVDKRRAERLAELISGRFQWWTQARMDRLAAVDLPKLERCGMSAVQPGIESGSARILKMINKGETVEDFIDANRKLARTGIIPLYNFMMGFPTETRVDIMDSVDLAVRLMEDNPRAQVSGFYVFVPHPGTELYDLAINHGFEPPKSVVEWASFNRQHLKTPWIQDHIDLVRSLLVSSKFVDGTRLRNRLRTAYKGLPFPSFVGTYLGKQYRRRWQRHDFDPRLDTTINNLILFLFSVSHSAPVDRWRRFVSRDTRQHNPNASGKPT